MAIDRKLARQQLATLLETELVTNSSLVQQFYNYRAGDFGSQTPVCELVSSAISAVAPLNLCADYDLECAFELSTFVWYADPSGTTWSEQEAIDRLDDIATLIVSTLQTIAKSPPTTYFDEIQFTTPSGIAVVSIGGVFYFRELFTITCSKAS